MCKWLPEQQLCQAVRQQLQAKQAQGSNEPATPRLARDAAASLQQRTLRVRTPMIGGFGGPTYKWCRPMVRKSLYALARLALPWMMNGVLCTCTWPCLCCLAWRSRAAPWSLATSRIGRSCGLVLVPALRSCRMKACCLGSCRVAAAGGRALQQASSTHTHARTPTYARTHAPASRAAGPWPSPARARSGRPGCRPRPRLRAP